MPTRRERRMTKDEQRLYDRLERVRQENPYDPANEYHVAIPLRAVIEEL